MIFRDFFIVKINFSLKKKKKKHINLWQYKSQRKARVNPDKGSQTATPRSRAFSQSRSTQDRKLKLKHRKTYFKRPKRSSAEILTSISEQNLKQLMVIIPDNNYAISTINITENEEHGDDHIQTQIWLVISSLLKNVVNYDADY